MQSMLLIFETVIAKAGLDSIFNRYIYIYSIFYYKNRDMKIVAAFKKKYRVSFCSRT